MRDEVDPHDPLGLDNVDREIRINELSEQVRELGMQAMHVSGECPPEVQGGFLSNIIEFDAAPISTQAAELERVGVELPPPETLDDAALSRKLWEVIHALAARSVYLYHTDHLSDRALYEYLWSDGLREQVSVFPPGSGWRTHLDVLGGCGEEDLELTLRYYDTEEQRRDWAEQFPDCVIPPHEDPPYDRDRHLPSAEDQQPEGEQEPIDEE
jgi:hypothetical protein